MDTPTVKKEDPRQLHMFETCKGSVCDNVNKCAIAGRCTYVSSAEQMRLDVESSMCARCKVNPQYDAATVLCRTCDEPKKKKDGALPSDSKERKTLPIATGVLDYFPAALAEVAKLSKLGNDKHNPGQPLHWSRGKSSDHADCIVRHLIDRGTIDPEDRLSHTVKVAWRALALLQEECESRGAPMSRGSK